MTRSWLPNIRLQKMMDQPRESEYRIFDHCNIIDPIVETMAINELVPQPKILWLPFEKTPVINQIPVESVNSRYCVRKEPKRHRNVMFMLWIDCWAQNFYEWCRIFCSVRQVMISFISMFIIFFASFFIFIGFILRIFCTPETLCQSEIRWKECRSFRNFIRKFRHLATHQSAKLSFGNNANRQMSIGKKLYGNRII